MSEESPAEAARASYEAALARLPPRPRRALGWLLSRWPGRVAVRSSLGFRRIELFDRSMTIAAQFFTSVFPIFIAVASWTDTNTDQLIDALRIPDESKSVVDQALASGSGNATFGLLGVLVVLASATSLSRALARAFAAMWELPRPTFRLTWAWRWVAAVLVLALALVASLGLPRYLGDIPPTTLWQLLSVLLVGAGVGVLLPWILLAGQVRPPDLLPGALLFGVVMIFLRLGSDLYLPHALDVSAERYGSIGVAFTYLAWLYTVSFCFLSASVIGQVVASDPGGLGRWITKPRRPWTSLHRHRGAGTA